MRTIVAAVMVGVLDLDGAGNQRFEGRLHGWNAGDGERAHGGAVVGVGTADDLRPAVVTHERVILPGQFPRGFHCS